MPMNAPHTPDRWTTHAGRDSNQPLHEVQFDDLLVRSLPADSETLNQPRQVRGAMYTATHPTAVSAPTLLAWSEDLAHELGLQRPTHGDQSEAILAGNALAPGMRPYASRYGGHQFGNWAAQLGDGRAITLGELIDRTGQRQELQLKGAGPTPYSRTADGRAVLRSSVREFLCSEAMFYLGIPTSRALSLVSTGDEVVRDMFYDGHAAPEPGAVVCRVAPSFIRFGHFEILAAQAEPELLRQLMDFVQAQHYPHCDGAVAWFTQLCERTAQLMVHWMRCGFVHGVMNTDNMSVLGLTIDYGPYGWLEGVDMNWTPNTTDAAGRRYCFGRQAQIAHWNLGRLASALNVVLDDADALQQALQHYADTFNWGFQHMLADKLGIGLAPDIDRAADAAASEADASEDGLSAELWPLLQLEECDFTLFFRRLAHVDVKLAADDGHDTEVLAPLHEAFYSGTGPGAATAIALRAWLRRWAARVQAGGEPDAERIARMHRTNPKYVLRNWLAQRAIDDAAQGDTAMIDRLLLMMRRPYDEQPEFDDLAGRRPEWARHKAGCSALSCSS